MTNIEEGNSNNEPFIRFGTFTRTREGILSNPSNAVDTWNHLELFRKNLEYWLEESSGESGEVTNWRNDLIELKLAQDALRELVPDVELQSEVQVRGIEAIRSNNE